MVPNTITSFFITIEIPPRLLCGLQNIKKVWSRIVYLTEGSSTTQAQTDIAIPHTWMIYAGHQIMPHITRQMMRASRSLCLMNLLDSLSRIKAKHFHQQYLTPSTFGKTCKYRKNKGTICIFTINMTLRPFHLTHLQCIALSPVHNWPVADVCASA